MSQWLLVYIIIAISILYIIYKVWQSFHHKHKDGCTGYCAGCPFAANVSSRSFAPCEKSSSKSRREKKNPKKKAKSLEE